MKDNLRYGLVLCILASEVPLMGDVFECLTLHRKYLLKYIAGLGYGYPMALFSVSVSVNVALMGNVFECSDLIREVTTQ